MGQLDKTFPTNDCSMCILSPKLVEVGSNENIELMMLTDVMSLEGEPGRFEVTVRRRPRYVDIEKCTGCGLCSEECRVKVKDPYNAGLSRAPLIRVPFPQAVPGAAFIDPTKCLYLLKGKCGNCKETCPAGAVDYEQKETVEKIEVGSVILAAGYKTFDAAARAEYGYGVYDNVVTSLEFERILAANGPTGGHVVRRSDGEPVTRRTPSASRSSSASARAIPRAGTRTAPRSAACTPRSSRSSRRSTRRTSSPASSSST